MWLFRNDSLCLTSVICRRENPKTLKPLLAKKLPLLLLLVQKLCLFPLRQNTRDAQRDLTESLTRDVRNSCYKFQKTGAVDQQGEAYSAVQSCSIMTRRES